MVAAREEGCPEEMVSLGILLQPHPHHQQPVGLPAGPPPLAESAKIDAVAYISVAYAYWPMLEPLRRGSRWC